MSKQDQELNSLTLNEVPEEYIENADGSVEIPEVDEVYPEEHEFPGNLTDILTDTQLYGVSSELIDSIEQDKASRQRRDEQYEEGLRRTGLGDDAPGGADFQGSSRVVHPVLVEGCIDFASRSIKELFPAQGPVKTQIVGTNDPIKLDRAQRKARFMNWQLTTQMVNYRSQLEQLLTQLPMGGSQYQKFSRDFSTGKPTVEFVPVDEVFIPYHADNLYSSPRITHRYPISRDDFQNRVAEGLYRDVFLPELSTGTLETSASQNANDKIEGREDDGYNEDGYRNILEVYCWQRIEDDPFSQGEYAPYIITIDEESERVLSIYRNWDPQDLKFQKLEWWVDWTFIPWRGAYGIGLPHIIGGLSGALTGALRALLDSAHINNSQTLLKLKAGRLTGQTTQVNVTQVHEIEGPPSTDDIRKIVMPMPFNPPSPVLMTLIDKIYGLAKGVISTSEDALGQVGDRTPVGTTMALIEQGSPVYSSIHARLHNSQKMALSILHRMNAQMLDEETVVKELGELIIRREEFMSSMDVLPVSDPTIFSEAQRFAQGQSLVQMSQDQRVPWNVPNIYRRLLRQMRIENPDEIIPPEKTPFTGDAWTENTKGLEANPLKAKPEQNHLAHLQSHLAFLESPLQAGNPAVSPQTVMGILQHINEHLNILQAQIVTRGAQAMMMSGQAMDPDTAVAMSLSQPPDVLYGPLVPYFERYTKLFTGTAQKLASSQHQMPPEVQASLQIAQMDTSRKQAYDQGMLKLREAEIQGTQQLKQQQLQLSTQEAQHKSELELQQQQFEARLQTERLSNDQQMEELRNQLRLIMNHQDNIQKQQTELLKNRDDNRTNLQIEEMRQGHESQMAQQDELSRFTELRNLMDSLEEGMSQEAVIDVLNKMRAIIPGS